MCHCRRWKYYPKCGGNLSSQRTLTDEKGCFSFENVDPGKNKLSVRKEGFSEVIVIVEAQKNGSVDMGTIMLPSKFEDITRIEELAEEEYVPGPDADNFIQYYTDMGFERTGAVRVEHTGRKTTITALATSTSSAFVFENDGAAGILFDFSERLKEIRVGNMVLVGSFGAEIEEYILLFPQEEITSDEDEKSHKIFLEKRKFVLSYSSNPVGVSKDFSLLHRTCGFSGGQTESSVSVSANTKGVLSANTKSTLPAIDKRIPLRFPNAKDEKEFYQIFYNKKMEKPAAHLFNKEIMRIREDLAHPDPLRNVRGLVNIIVSVPTGFQDLLLAVSGYSTVAVELCEALREAIQEMKERLENEWIELIDEEQKYIDLMEVSERLKKVYEDLLQKKIEEKEKIIEQGKGCEGSEVKKIEKEIKEIEEQIADYEGEIQWCKDQLNWIGKRLIEIQQTIAELDWLLSHYFSKCR